MTKLEIYNELLENRGSIKAVAEKASVSRNTVRNFLKKGFDSIQGEQIMDAAVAQVEAIRVKQQQQFIKRRELGQKLMQKGQELMSSAV